MIPGQASQGIIYLTQMLGVVIPTSQMRKRGTKNGGDSQSLRALQATTVSQD